MEHISWITDDDGNNPKFHIFKKYNLDKIPFGRFDYFFSNRLMSLNVIEASFDEDVNFYSKSLTFRHRKDNYMMDIYILSESDDDETQQPDLCLCSCSLDLKKTYSNYLKTNRKKDFLLNDKSCSVNTVFFSSSPSYHKLFSETVKLIESGISLKFNENKKADHFRWIEFGFTFEGTYIFIDCSFMQTENNSFEKILNDWDIFFKDIIKKNNVLKKVPSSYEISFERSIMELIHDLGISD